MACGNVGLPIVEAVMAEAAADHPLDVYAVELSSFQLHYSDSLSCESAAVLNVAEDHLDWYSSFEDYAADKGRIYHDVQRACVYNVADPTTEQLVRDAEVVEGARAIGFTLGIPAVGMVGVVDEILADRAFIEQRQHSAAELCTVDDLASAGPALRRQRPGRRRAGSRSRGEPGGGARRAARLPARRAPHRPGRPRSTRCDYVDDSKATNPHAARASLQAYEHVVWVAGGLAKGARFDDLVQSVRERLRGVVLLGRDRAVIAEALRRHAPEVPVIEVEDHDTGAMDRVVRAAAGLARPGDTVLLAPGCASMDMFANYGARGDAFAESVSRLREE